MGYGQGPYGTTDGTPPSLPAQVPTSLSSSRQIDGVTRRYVQDTHGGFAAMDDVAQRVLLLVSFAELNATVITPQTLNDQANAIRAALVPLLDVKTPAISLIAVDVTRSASGTMTKAVTYKNLLTDTQTTITR